jgi:hypothetical protein
VVITCGVVITKAIVEYIGKATPMSDLDIDVPNGKLKVKFQPATTGSIIIFCTIEVVRPPEVEDGFDELSFGIDSDGIILQIEAYVMSQLIDEGIEVSTIESKLGEDESAIEGEVVEVKFAPNCFTRCFRNRF